MAKKRANGEGNIRKRKDGRWEGRYSAGYDSKTGKRIVKSVLGRTQAEVKEKLKAAIEETKGLDVSRSEEYTVATWLRTWYALYAKPNIRVATADRYQLMIETYTIPRIGDIKLKKLTSRYLQKLYKDLLENGRVNRKSGKGNPGLSSTTVRSVHLMLHCAFQRAVKERPIRISITEDCIAPKVQKIEMKILPADHIKSYLDAANARGLLPMFYLELVSGLRKGELVALRWDDLDTQNRTISISKQYIKNPNGELTLSRPKTETSVRQVSIPQTAVNLLIQEHEKHPDNPYLFPSPVTGEMYYPDSVVNLHKKILKDAGLEHIRFHDLRHTFATTALQNGVDIKTVSSMLGHLRRRIHAPHLHPRHPADAGTGGGEDGKFYETGPVTPSKKTPDRKGSFLSGALVSIGSFRDVGHGVGPLSSLHFSALQIVKICNKKHPKPEDFRCFLELLGGFEPPTSSLPMVAARSFFVFSLKKGSCNVPANHIFF